MSLQRIVSVLSSIQLIRYSTERVKCASKRNLGYHSMLASFHAFHSLPFRRGDKCCRETAKDNPLFSVKAH